MDDSTGWIIPAGSVEGIVEAMGAALEASPKELAAKGQAGRARVEAVHDVDKEAARLLSHIKALCTS